MQLPRWAREYVGTPFLKHGRSHDGCDCWGLCRLVWAEQFGLDVPSFATTYADTSDGTSVEATIRSNGTDSSTWRSVPAGDERAGDAVHMTGYTREADGLRRHKMHIGVVIAPGWLLHVEAGIDANVVNYRRDRAIVRRVLGFYRHRDLDV